jgi:glucose/arabinose dehydrogenase
MRRGAWGICVAASIVLLLLAASAPAAVPAGYGESTVASGLEQPTAIAFIPDGRILVTTKEGGLYAVEDGSKTLVASFTVCTEKSMGLLGIAVDPDFASNGFVYLYRTKPAAGEGPACPTTTGRVNEVIRVELEGDRLAGAPTPILSGIRTDNGQHNGGALRIGPDRLLYISTGDTGVGDFLPGGFTPPGGSTNPFAQDTGQLPGKVLRIALDGTIPLDNPFAGARGARAEVFAYGFRNPFRFGIDPVTGRLWLGDVGQNTWEELNIVRAGGNYGWPLCEGTDPEGCDPSGHVAPVFTYRQDIPGSLGASITGGAFAPCGFGAFAGQYLFGDYVSDRLYRVLPNAARDGIEGAPALFAEGAAGPVDIVFGPDGALYYVAIKAGEVRRVAAAETACRGASSTETASTGEIVRAPGFRTVPTADRNPPRLHLRFSKRQHAKALVLSLRLEEPARITVKAKATLRARSKPYRYRKLHRRVPGAGTVRLRLHPRIALAAALRRHTRFGRRPTARVTIRAVDASGNSTRRTLRISLVRG